MAGVAEYFQEGLQEGLIAPKWSQFAPDSALRLADAATCGWPPSQAASALPSRRHPLWLRPGRHAAPGRMPGCGSKRRR